MLMKNIVLCFVVLFVVGCQSELYTGLSQKEGNEMLSILLDAQISAQKQPDKENKVKIMVNDAHLPIALELLKSQGYPKEKFSSLKEIFPSDSLISSPLEERARLNYVQSQSLSSTLSQIDGVITARVHIVDSEMHNMNEKNNKKELHKATASVFIKHTPDIDINLLVPQIKLLVANSVLGIHKEDIGVVLVQAEESSLYMKLKQKEMSLVAEESESHVNPMTVFISIFVLMVVVFISNLITFVVMKRKNMTA